MSKKFSAKNLDIMRHVDISEQIRVHIFDMGHGVFRIDTECLDRNKKLVFDESAKRTLEEEIIKRSRQMNAKDPKTKMWMEEFFVKMISSMAKNGLVELAEIEDAPDDPYAQARRID